jgi:hypothetical protein
MTQAAVHALPTMILGGRMGNATTFAGGRCASPTDGTGTNAKFMRPGALCYDAATGSMYTVETFSPNNWPYYGNGGRIRKVTAAGVVTTVTSAWIDEGQDAVQSCAVAGGKLYISHGSVLHVSMVTGDVTTW